MRRNERFYRGDQWHGICTDLPRPVFNLVRRITDYLVAGVMSENLTVRYSDDALPFIREPDARERILQGIEVLNKNALWRWQQGRMEVLSYGALLDAAISGDGVFYCWWDPDHTDGQLYTGDIRTDRIDSTNLFVSDVNCSDLQSQEYVLLSGRATVSSLRHEALEAGVSERDVLRITGDGEAELQAGDLAKCELNNAEKTTYLIRFFRENGEVVFEKSTRYCLIRRVHTGLHHYPVAYFHWHDCKNSFHGSAPISDMIANQKYINSAYALAMKHMSDTAFSKVVYDKSRIPDWSNEVGEAIAAMGGGNVADAVSVVGVGKMQDGYLDLITHIIENTKSMMNATDAALGDAEANNTSAILALQEASQLALAHVRANFQRCIGELADIWADMICTYYPAERLLVTLDADGTQSAQETDFALMKKELLRATAQVNGLSSYTPSATVTVLDKLLDKGHLDVRQYLELLPDGVLIDRDAMIQKIFVKGASENE
ncbi:MAG: hypothetical protein IJW92_06010 [Clostridia bacterium]|nr:hypothetical protein [Clostridia bacterium]